MTRQIEPQSARWRRCLIVIHRAALAAQLLLLSMPLAAAEHHGDAFRAARSAPTLTRLSTTAQEGGIDVGELVAGAPVERELAGGQVHAYRMMLATGQYLQVTIEQRGIDVVGALRGP